MDNWGAIIGDDLGAYSSINSMYFIDLLTIDTSLNYITTGTKSYDHVDLDKFNMRATIIDILSSPYGMIEVNLEGKTLNYRIQTNRIQIVRILVTIHAK